MSTFGLLWVNQCWVKEENMWRVDGALRAALSNAADQQRSRCICLGALTYSDKRGHVTTGVRPGSCSVSSSQLQHSELFRAQSERQPVNNLQLMKERAVKDIHYLWLSAIRATWITTSFSMGPCRRHKTERSVLGTAPVENAALSC